MKRKIERARASVQVSGHIMRGDRDAAITEVWRWAQGEVRAENEDHPRRRASDFRRAR